MHPLLDASGGKEPLSRRGGSSHMSGARARHVRVTGGRGAACVVQRGPVRCELGPPTGGPACTGDEGVARLAAVAVGAHLLRRRRPTTREYRRRIRRRARGGRSGWSLTKRAGEARCRWVLHSCPAASAHLHDARALRVTEQLDHVSAEGGGHRLVHRGERGELGDEIVAEGAAAAPAASATPLGRWRRWRVAPTEPCLTERDAPGTARAPARLGRRDSTAARRGGRGRPSEAGAGRRAPGPAREPSPCPPREPARMRGWTSSSASATAGASAAEPAAARAAASAPAPRPGASASPSVSGRESAYRRGSPPAGPSASRRPLPSPSAPARTSPAAGTASRARPGACSRAVLPSLGRRSTRSTRCPAPIRSSRAPTTRPVQPQPRAAAFAPSCGPDGAPAGPMGG
eukprot:scaffold15324_cov112-Isochrysis_galbana.AAC.5